MVATLIDRALDLTVLPGYTKTGYALRQRDWAEDLPSLTGRTVVVTGATSGIGRAAAQRFAALGARVVLIARSQERGERAAAEIRAATGNSEVAVVVGDLASLESVKAAAATIVEQEAAVDVLVNNAGVLPPARELSVDGHELTFATNVLGMVALTEGLLPRLVATAPSRIINVSSGGMYTAKLDVDDLQAEHGDFDGAAVYAHTKRMQVILTEQWGERLRPAGVVVHSMHPGWVATPGVETSLPRFNKVMGPLLRDADQGADTIVWLGAADEPLRTTGRFWHDRRTRPTHRVPMTREREEDRTRLWDAVHRLAGTEPV